MYVPRHFRTPDQQTGLAVIDQIGFGDMTSLIDGQMHCTAMPFLRDGDYLLGHLARANPQAAFQPGAEVQVTFAGPHGYVSPGWYQAPGVPTWNYVAVHVYGVPEILTDAQAVHDLLARLTAKYESGLANPWQPDYDPRQLNAIVAFRLPIARLDTKLKLSQNRSAEDRAGVIAGLRAVGNTALADLMQAREDQA